MKFSDIDTNSNIYLYAGENFYAKWDEYKSKTKFKWIGVWKDLDTDLFSQNKGLINENNPASNYNIKHDITTRHNIDDNCVDIYQSEDVFEHIEYNLLKDTINDIYRILKPNGLFRLSIPDYNDKNIKLRCIVNKNNEILYDPGGGGRFVNNKVVDGGHVWFPTIKKMRQLLDSTNFKKINFLSYYEDIENKGRSKQKHIHHNIDYSLGYIKRTPDFSYKKSIVIDCYK